MTEHDDDEENNKCEQDSCFGCKDKIEISDEKDVRLEAEKCDDAADFGVCKSKGRNTCEVFQKRENNVDMKCSTDDSYGIKKTQHVRFHNPPRHVFNLAVKVCL